MVFFGGFLHDGIPLGPILGPFVFCPFAMTLKILVNFYSFLLQRQLRFKLFCKNEQTQNNSLRNYTQLGAGGRGAVLMVLFTIQYVIIP